MSENMTEENRIPEKRVYYQDEAERRKLRSRVRRMRTWLVILPLFFLLAGWALGSFVPLPFSSRTKHNMSILLPLDDEKKFGNILDIMSGDWFFASGIPDISTRLQDQAYYGMTANEEDPHTSYMSAEEIASFTQSINRNFIGIGVQFYSTADGLHLVQRVLRGTPAEAAGVLPGDIIHGVDGVNVDGMTSSEVVDLVRGEEGTPVVIDFLRDNRTVTLKIVRRAVSSTTYGRILDEKTGYLQIQQFGETTGEECRAILDEFSESGVHDLVIDVRDDGGGYLSALQDVMGCFVKEGTVVLRQVYSDGSETEIRSKGKPYGFIENTVILVNSNTASAAEAFTLAMRELCDGVQTVGITTYGKGTVQITRQFSDGSGLKYTTSKWVSPEGVWVNGTGIEPDHEVYLDDVLYEQFPAMEDGVLFEVDSVSAYTSLAQKSLLFLGTADVRTDGYLDEDTSSALSRFQEENGLEVNGSLDEATYTTLLSQVVYAWNSSDEHDPQLQKALEVLHE